MTDLDIVTRQLISQQSIREKLPAIFQDAIIVDLRFNILVVSQNVLEFLEFTNEELKDKSLNYLTGGVDVVSQLNVWMAEGYCNERVVEFQSKGGHAIQIGISGFYLGLITDINGRIILKIRNLSEISVINKELQKKKTELDSFIYRVSHDLRGPLATVLGLVNLLKIRKDDSEVDRIVQMIDAHSVKLDELLFQLVYMARVDESDREPMYLVDFAELEMHLRKIIEQNAFIDFLDLQFMVQATHVDNVNEHHLRGMLSNLLLYLLSLPKKDLHHRVSIAVAQTNSLAITIDADGFVVSEKLREAFFRETSIYTDLLNYPRLVNYYAAQKIGWALNAQLNIRFLSEERQVIHIDIPFGRG